MNKYDCILFDLDGTLIDSTPLIIESFKHTFLHHYILVMKDEDIIKFLGIPLIKPFTEMYPDDVDELIKTYREFNEYNHDYYTGVFIGVPYMLEQCKNRGILLGVVTSKRRDLAMNGMKLFGLDDYMDVFVGFEDTRIHKPEGDPILKALETVGIKDKEHVLYVGDSSYDVLCAKNAGVKSAAVTGWSYIPDNELLVLEPDICLSNPLELLSYIEE
jgi:pyrophosphatase PpaX